jgi:prepilin-type processing-associated H-X9-DG protein
MWRKINKSKVTQEEFNDLFFELLHKGSKNMVWVGGHAVPSNQIEIRDENNDWLFNYKYDGKKSHFWYNYPRVSLIFSNRFNINYVEVQELMRDIVDNHLKLKGVTPRMGM